MEQLGRFIIILSLVLALAGLVLWGLGRSGFRGLPGDVTFSTGRVTVFFPVVTCLVLSFILSLGWWLWRWFTRG